MNVNMLTECKNILIKSPIYFMTGFVFSVITTLVITFLNTAGNGNYIEESYSSEAMLFLISVIASPLTEELLFRKFLFNFICKKKLNINFWPAAAVSSFLFGIFHQTVATVITAIVLSMLLCYVYEREQKIIFDIVMHAGFNMLSFIVVALI